MKSVSKIELHLHLEGAAPPAFIKELGSRKKLRLEGVFDSNGDYKFSNFNHFLAVYEEATNVLQTPEDFFDLTSAVLEQSAQHGVIYTEAFLSPDFCGNRDVSAWKEYLAAIEEAAHRAKQKFGIEMRGIVTCIRHFGPDKAKETAFCAAETFGEFVTGFGIAGDEMAGKPVDFTYAFDMAREAGLRLTAHAGEWGGAQSVFETVRDLNVERIGHGVQSVNDPKLVKELVNKGITLEVCPGSNIALGVYKAWGEHPIERLRDAGVLVTISTDDPPFFHTDLSTEYEMLEQTFGWDLGDFKELNINAANAAFCDETTRKRLIEKLEA